VATPAAIHRRDPGMVRYGHCVTLYWNDRGKIGSLSKSSFDGLGHRDAVFSSECDVAASYASYLRMGIQPLCFR
jgi:hypothetical protein